MSSGVTSAALLPPAGEPAARLRVLYADTDAGGVVYHRYRTPAFYDDILLIYVGTSELRRVQVTFDYQVRREPDNEVVVTGRTVHACMDLGEGRVCALPAWAVGGLRLPQLPQAKDS